jgi:hypothetical protein
MQDEQREDSSDQNTEAQQQDLEKWELALSVLKEAVINAGIKDISEYKGEPLNLRWHTFSQEIPNTVLLKMLVKGIFGTIRADVELILTARWVIDEVELVLKQPDANRSSLIRFLWLLLNFSAMLFEILYSLTSRATSSHC